MSRCVVTSPIAATRPARRAIPWHQRSGAECLELLQVDSSGLTDAEAERRFKAEGANELQAAAPRGPLRFFARQFQTFMVWLLILAGGIAGALGEVADAIAIFAIVLLNAMIGGVQEYQADRSIAALRKLTAPQARVRRGGRSLVVPATQLVTGDIVELEAGDLVAADARVLDAMALQCMESTLTGEAEPVLKTAVPQPEEDLPLGDRTNMLFKGTSITMGQGLAVVVATGMNTELGRIAGMLQQSGPETSTPLQVQLAAFGRLLVWVSLGTVVLLFGLGLLRGMPFMEIFLTSVSLAVAAVPEGLPTIVTIALALGVMRMARLRALVRRLPAVEMLGCTNVICTDKTGTLTMGDMTVRALYVAGQSYAVTGEGYGPHGEILIEGRTTGTEHAEPLLELATALLACNNAELVLADGLWQVIGDPTEGAMLVAGHKAGGHRDRVEEALPRHHEIPFDSERKRRTVIRRMPEGQLRAFVNGAPEELLRRSASIYTESGVQPLTEEDARTLQAQNERLAGQGLRVLASAYRDLPVGTLAKEITADQERDLVFVGLVGMMDPPRPEARAAVARCQAAGIRVVMITGDHPHTALAIARDLGIASMNETATTGKELDHISDAELSEQAPHLAVYARVTPEHKLRIVRAWQANQAVVAMTGDGVNDAPALKGADIGIAMGIKGSEVSKQAADVIVTDDNFASIVVAVEQGRGLFDNIRKTLQYLLTDNTAELALMAACIIVGLPAPLLPIHLLWINLVTDGLPALALATDNITPGAMNRPPRPRSERLLGRRFLIRFIIAGGLTPLLCFGIFSWALQRGNIEYARSLTFTGLVFCSLLKSLSFRSETEPAWHFTSLTSLKLPIVVAASFVLQLLLHHVPFLSHFLKTVTPPWDERWMLLGVGFVPLIALELLKRWQSGRNPNQQNAQEPSQLAHSDHHAGLGA